MTAWLFSLLSKWLGPWASIISLILQWAYQAWKSSRAEKNEDEERLSAVRQKQMEILKAIVAKDSGYLSRRAANRADRLRLLLSSDDVKDEEPTVP